MQNVSVDDPWVIMHADFTTAVDVLCTVIRTCIQLNKPCWMTKAVFDALYEKNKL